MQIGYLGNTPAQTSAIVGQPAQQTETNTPAPVTFDRVDVMNSPASLRALGQGLRNAQDPAAIQRMWNETDQAAETIRRLITDMLGRGQVAFSNNVANFSITEAERAEAEALIAEDGFFGVERTTERLVGFAKALIGENASDEQIETMRAAVQRGFDDVARMFGGFDNLPQVTRDTHTATMAAFDQWLGRGASEAS